MKIIPLFAILGLLVVGSLTSCTSIDDKVWFTKDATYCAEAWQDATWTSDDNAENAETWLEMEGITVLKSEYDPEGRTPEVCRACSCLSGGVHRVQTTVEFTDMMVSEGFELE